MAAGAALGCFSRRGGDGRITAPDIWDVDVLIDATANITVAKRLESISAPIGGLAGSVARLDRQGGEVRVLLGPLAVAEVAKILRVLGSWVTNRTAPVLI